MFGYTNSDWKRDLEQKKSIKGYLFMYYDALVAWSSRKQDVVALSTCDAEYVAGSLGACQAVWMMNLLKELKLREKRPVCLLIDNKSTINLAKHPTLHGRSKHIELKFRYIRDQVSKGNVNVEYCQTEEQLADLMTKLVQVSRFKQICSRLINSLKDLN